MAGKTALKPWDRVEPTPLSRLSFGDLLLGMAGVGEAAESGRLEPVLTGRSAREGRGGVVPPAAVRAKQAPRRRK